MILKTTLLGLYYKCFINESFINNHELIEQLINKLKLFSLNCRENAYIYSKGVRRLTSKISNLEFIQTCQKYGVRKDENISHLIKGQQAEDRLFKLLTRHLNNSGLEYKIYTDINLSKYHRTQIDIIVILNGFVWIIEVKNYNGVLKLKNQTLCLNQYTLERNEISHCQTRSNIVKSIFKEEFEIMPKINTTLFLMNENSEFITDCTPPIEVITINMANRIISETIQEAKRINFSPSLSEIQKVIERNTVDSFVMPTPLTYNEIQNIDCGPRCEKCQQKLSTFNNTHLYCENCNQKVKKKNAVINAFKDISILFYNSKKFINSVDILWLLDHYITNVSVHNT